MAVSKRLRFEILRRDNFQCRYCGAKPPETELRIDHVTPAALGGATVPENLVAACEPCNSGKSSIAPDSPLVANVLQDAVRWARAIEQAQAIRRTKIEAREAYAAYFFALWEQWRTGKGQSSGNPVPLDDGWRATIDRFYEYDVDPDDIKHAVDTAMTAVNVRPENTFRYFCGIIWRIVRELQQMAGEIVVADLDTDIYGER